MTIARILIILTCLGGLAHADKQQARPHIQAGDVDYKLGKFEEALVEYTKAYELYPVPALLFNLGQCHRNLKNFERAVFFYEGYLRDSPADTANRAVVEDLLREAKIERDKQSVEEQATRRTAEAIREKAAIEAARVQAEQEGRLRAEEARRRDEDRRIAEARRAEQANKPVYKKWWFWSAVGGAALALGGTAYYLSGDTTVTPPTGTLGGLDRR
jgi:tetratricopeptide (TPR) repeat protein